MLLNAVKPLKVLPSSERVLLEVTPMLLLGSLRPPQKASAKEKGPHQGGTAPPMGAAMFTLRIQLLLPT